MNKKKAIKIASATVIAASAFTAVAPAQSEAATSLSSKVKTAKATIKKPYSTYFNATKLASVSTVEKQIKAAKTAKTNILKTIKNSSSSKTTKAKYTKEINDYTKYITRAEGYVKGYNAAAKAQTANNKISAQLEAAIIAQDGAEIKKQYKALDAAVKKTDKAIKDAVYGGKIETLLYNKFTKAVKADLAGDLKVAYYGDKIQYWIAKEDLATAAKRYADIAPLLLQVDTTSELGQAIIKYAEAVKADYDAALKAVEDAEAAVKYAEVKKAVEAKVNAYVALADGELKTQVQVDAAKEAAKAIDLTELNVADKATLQTQVEAADKKVAAAEEVLAVPVNAAVDSVKANNLKTVVVTFNQSVNKDVLGTITVKDSSNNTVTLDATQGTKLSENGKTLSITASSTFTQGKEYSLKIEGAKTVAGKDVTTYDNKFTVLDTTVPVAETATITSPKTIELGFSEAVTSNIFTSGIDAFAGVLTDLVQIDGVNAYVDQISFDYSTKKVQLQLNNALATGEHTIKVLGFKDHAGFPIATKEFKSTLAADTAAPTVTAAQVIGYEKVRVTFDEVINKPANGNFTLTVGSTTYTVTDIDAVTGDQKSYDLTLNNALGLGAVVEAKLTYKNVKDFYNNEVTTEKSFAFNATDETSLPTVVSNTLNSDNTVEITFSEDVEGLAQGDLELVDKDNKVVANGVTGVAAKTISGVTSKKVYIVNLATSVNTGANYTLKLKKDAVNDFSIRKNQNAEQTFSLSTKDAVKPNVASVLQTVESSNNVNNDSDNLDTKLVVYFNEEMDKTTLENKANYLVGNTPVGSNVTITPAQDGKSVTLVINRTAPDTQLDFNGAGATTFKVLNLKDATGNLVENFNTDLTVTDYSSTDEIVSDVELVAKNQMKIVPNGTHKITAVNLNNIQVVDTNSVTVYAQATRVVSYNTDGSVTVELSRNLSADKVAAVAVGSDIAIGDALRVKFTSNAVTNAQGQTQTLNADDNKAFYDTSITDKVKASLVVTDTDNDGLIDVDATAKTITLTFDENVYANATELESALVIKNNAQTRLATSAYNVTVDNTATSTNTKTVIITLVPDSTVDYTGSFTVSLPENVSLKDINGNLANSVSTITTESLTIDSLANSAITTAKNLVVDQTLTTSDTSLLTVLNAVEGISATGVTLGVKAAVTGPAETATAAIAQNGTITRGTTQQVLNVVITIAKTNGTTVEKTIKVTVPAAE